MASSDNLMTMEQPWDFRPTFTDAWISDIYVKETDTMAKALQRSFTSPACYSAEMVKSVFVGPEVATVQAPMASGCSENKDASFSKLRRGLPPAGGRVTKRKSRASKRSTTTFITSDAVNFRQMVQQVTGVRSSGEGGALPLTPAPVGLVDRLQVSGVLPTFDTSAFLLDGSAANLVMQPRAAAGHDGSVPEFDPFGSFPTLESWKVV